MASRMKLSFNCPHCNALYHIVRGEARPETVYSEITCRACGGSLPAREGQFVLKYFLLRKGLPPAGSQRGPLRATDAK